MSKARHRHTRSGHPYADKDTGVYEAKVAIMARQVCRKPIIGPVAVWIMAYWTMPKKHQRAEPTPPLRKFTLPDVDNLIKSVLDGMQGIVFRNDSQVAVVHAEKWYAGQNDHARVEVEVTEIASTSG